jgi:hypothetical protein
VVPDDIEAFGGTPVLDPITISNSDLVIRAVFMGPWFGLAIIDPRLIHDFREFRVVVVINSTTPEELEFIGAGFHEVALKGPGDLNGSL